MNRISASPMVLRVVALAITVMMMLVIAFTAAHQSEARRGHHHNRGHHNRGHVQDCDQATVNTGGGDFLLPFKHQYPTTGPINVGGQNAICIDQAHRR
jgi:hypothetical protein